MGDARIPTGQIKLGGGRAISDFLGSVSTASTTGQQIFACCLLCNAWVITDMKWDTALTQGIHNLLGRISVFIYKHSQIVPRVQEKTSLKKKKSLRLLEVQSSEQRFQMAEVQQKALGCTLHSGTVLVRASAQCFACIVLLTKRKKRKNKSTIHQKHGGDDTCPAWRGSCCLFALGII